MANVLVAALVKKPIHLRRAYRIHSTWNDPLPEGPIEKLLVCEGVWEERRWHERWLRAGTTDDPRNPTEVFYCSEGRKLMHRIICQDVCKIGLIKDLISSENHQKIMPDNYSLWPLILKNQNNFQEMDMCFYISTLPKGSRKGKEYLFKAKTKEDLAKWAIVVQSMCARGQGEHIFSKFRRTCRTIYKSRTFELCVGLMICINFLIIVVETQTLPSPGSELHLIIDAFNWILSLIFAVELVLNIFVNKLRDFCQDYWNW